MLKLNYNANIQNRIKQDKKMGTHCVPIKTICHPV